MAVIAAADADIVCLQEVTYKTREMLLKDAFMLNTYCKNGCFSGNNFHTFYGVMIFSKLPASFYELEFDSRMGRTLLVCETYDNSLPVIATAHFESLNSASIRKGQMETSC